MNSKSAPRAEELTPTRRRDVLEEFYGRRFDIDGETVRLHARRWRCQGCADMGCQHQRRRFGGAERWDGFCSHMDMAVVPGRKRTVRCRIGGSGCWIVMVVRSTTIMSMMVNIGMRRMQMVMVNSRIGMVVNLDARQPHQHEECLEAGREQSPRAPVHRAGRYATEMTCQIAMLEVPTGTAFLHQSLPFHP
jgi:hypothetical protein